MKNKKLKLNELKVQSFVTALKGNEKVTVAGAGTGDCTDYNGPCPDPKPQPSPGSDWCFTDWGWWCVA